MYGPKSVGALYIRRKNPRVKVIAQIDGGGHERNMRSGTLNVPGIVGFGKACELCRIDMKKDMEQIKKLRDKLEFELLKNGDVYINGSVENRLPNTSNLSFKYVDSEALMLGFNKNIAVSSGSACTSATLEPSYVLRAIGVEDDLAKAAIRFGLSRFTTEAEIDYTIQLVSETVLKLRSTSPLRQMARTGIDFEKI
jgi:cysteine desulfurase